MDNIEIKLTRVFYECAECGGSLQIVASKKYRDGKHIKLSICQPCLEAKLKKACDLCEPQKALEIEIVQLKEANKKLQLEAEYKNLDC